MSAKCQKQTLNASSPISGNPAPDRWIAASPTLKLIHNEVSSQFASMGGKMPLTIDGVRGFTRHLGDKFGVKNSGLVIAETLMQQCAISNGDNVLWIESDRGVQVLKRFPVMTLLEE